MPMFISFKSINQQNNLIIKEMNTLLRKIAYDGRANLKVRFRRIEKSCNKYLIEVITSSTSNSSTIYLNTNPFNIFWFIFSKNKIKKSFLFKHCKKSKYGGYTFY